MTRSLSAIKIQIRRLGNTLDHLELRDKKLYQKCSDALQKKNNPLAVMYANECAEVRKITKLTLASQLALEKAALRLETVREFGDIAHNMTEASQVVSVIKDSLRDVMPEVSMKLEEINENMEAMILEAGEATESTQGLTPTVEADKILKEVNIIAEHKLKEEFPDLPGQLAEEKIKDSR